MKTKQAMYARYIINLFEWVKMVKYDHIWIRQVGDILGDNV